MTTLRKFIDNCNIDAEVLYDEPMAAHTTFRIGGPADALVRPRSAGALAALVMAARDEAVPVTILGGGANLLVGDKGVRGIVASTELLRSTSLGDSHGGAADKPHGEAACSLDPEARLMYAEAGLPVVTLGRLACGYGLSGLEFAAGLPGSVGGAVYMNARCYDREFADLIERVDYLEQGSYAFSSLAVSRDDWAYKRTPFMAGGQLSGAIIVGAAFRLVPGDGAAIEAAMAGHEADRVAKGHFDWPSAGSLFKNDRAFGRPSGKILDELGFRGRRIGDAMVSPKHANIFVNAGAAKATDMVALIEAARKAAMETFGIRLEPEVVMLGEF